VTRKIGEVVGLDLGVDIIAPSHGVIWRDDPLQIVKEYQVWAAQQPESRAVILYDTMWNGTRRIAEAIGDGLAGPGHAGMLASKHRARYNPTTFRDRLTTQ
jgi:flavorubredoxin